MATTYTFQPNYAIPPGETLRELLDEKGLSQSDLARRTGMAEKTISQIISGEAPITLDTANKLELVLGTPATFWNKRELAYREVLSKLESAEQFASDIEWLKEIPWKELVSGGFIEDCADKAERVRRALRFFCVSSVRAWRETFLKPAAQFRGGDVAKKHPAKVAAWLRMGEIKAAERNCASYDEKKFKAAIAEIRKLITSGAENWHPAMISRCAEAGVAVVFVREIAGASVSGATHWVNKDKAILQLSLKYKREDQILFSFFHEAAHILKHGKKMVFVESDGNEDELEREANEFARQTLVDPRFDSEIVRLLPKCSHTEVAGLAHRAQVPPGVIVGRLHRMGMDKRFFHGLLVTLKWK